MYPKTFEEFVNSEKYNSIPIASARKMGVPAEDIDDVLMRVYEYLLKKRIVEKFNPNYVYGGKNTPLNKIGKKASFSGYIGTYVYYMWQRHKREQQRHMCLVYINNSEFFKSSRYKCVSDWILKINPTEELETDIYISQFMGYIKGISVNSNNPHISLVELLEKRLAGYTYRDLASFYGVSCTSVMNWFCRLKEFAYAWFQEGNTNVPAFR